MALLRLIALSLAIVLIAASDPYHSSTAPNLSAGDTSNAFRHDRSPAESDVDCEIRRLAYAYSKQLMPERGSLRDVFDGLEYGRLCNITAPEPTPYTRPAPVLQGTIFYINGASGSDQNIGSLDKPLKTIDRGLGMCRLNVTRCTLVLRGGEYYVPRTIKLYSSDENLSIVGMQNERVVLSGGKYVNPVWQKLDRNSVDWMPGKNLFGSSSPQWKSNSAGIRFAGEKADRESCFSTCTSSLGCYGVVYYTARHPNYPSQCFHKTDVHFSFGSDPESFCAINKEIYVADLSSELLQNPVNTIVVGGRRAIRARFPNGNPETMGYHTVPSGLIDKAESWKEYSRPGPAIEIHIKEPSIPNTLYKYYMIGLGGAAKNFHPAESYWALANPTAGGGSTYTLPESLEYDPKTFTPNKWSNASTGVLHAFHNGHWGNWMFRLDSRDESANRLHWNYGGFQEARGRPSGTEWYVENIYEELDAPGEWFFDEQSKKLYYYPNGTIAEASQIIIPQHSQILEGSGTQTNPLRGVTIDGVTFAYTLTTFMEDYLVPSGGDWSIHPAGSVMFGGVEGLTIRNCMFDTIGGNGLYLHDYARDVVIANNEFKWIGDSAIVSYGTTGLSDGTQGSQPRRTRILSNLIHEVGIFGKQTAAYFQAKTAETTVIGNIMFNGPRSGMNMNDGFGGGHLIQNNLLFNWVRETSDHGPINTWDRMLFLNDIYTPGTPSFHPKESEIKRNFLINNYFSTWPIDHDDGSCYYTDTNNVLIYGGFKNYLGHSLQGYEVYWTNNTCLINTRTVYKFSADGVAEVRLNDAQINIDNWRSKGFDVRSNFQKLSEYPLERLTQKIKENLQMKE